MSRKARNVCRCRIGGIIDEDSCQMQKEFAECLGVTQQTMSLLLKTMGMAQKQGYQKQKELAKTLKVTQQEMLLHLKALGIVQ